jgi:hypothetical protein
MLPRVSTTGDHLGNLPPDGPGPRTPQRTERAGTQRAPPASRRLRWPVARRPSGGTQGNEILTNCAATVLVFLLVAEGITITHMSGLRSAHMFIGLVLVPPVLLKLGSAGYRMVNYYAGTRAYRLSGPPVLPLRVMAPVLVASVLSVLTSGVLLLATGHKSNAILTIHRLSAIVFGALLAVHFMAYVPRVVRSLRTDWTAARRQVVPGTGARAMLVAAAIGGGAALALALLPTIHAYGN